MAIFTFRHSEQNSDLEKALQGIPFSGNIVFSYDGGQKTETKETATPVYLLSLDVHDTVSYGYFIVDGRAAEAPIGFSRKNNFLFKEYFRPDSAGDIVKERQSNEETLYLPLKLTDIITPIGRHVQNKFVPDKGSPFTIMGIDGSKGVYPLFLISETEEGIKCYGFYKGKNGELLTYSHGINNSDHNKLRKFLQTLKEGNTAERRVLVETAQRGGDKSSLSAGGLEGIANGDLNWEEPKSIVAYLNQYVVGQEDAKMNIAVAFSSYMTKVRTNREDLRKDNLLLIGPSGVGKTYMLSLLAKKASLPMVQTKLTGKSTEGYKGENLSTVFEQMRAMTTGEAPYGIIFFDEIDKVARDELGEPGFGARLQDELIGWLEEAIVLADKKDDNNNYNGLNTRNILFVTAGAFQGVSEDMSLAGIIRKRLGRGQKQVGFGSRQGAKDTPEEYILRKVRPEDLIAYGVKPELVGRLPALGVLHPLTVEDKVRILTATKRSPITNYSQLLQLKGYTVEVDDAVAEIIAQRCPDETGARALNAICNDLFTDILFDPQQYADDNKVIRVTPDVARRLINLY